MYLMGTGEAQSLGLGWSFEPGTQAPDTHLAICTHHLPFHRRCCFRDSFGTGRGADLRTNSCYSDKLSVSCSHLLITYWVQSPRVGLLCCGQEEAKCKTKGAVQASKGSIIWPPSNPPSSHPPSKHLGIVYFLCSRPCVGAMWQGGGVGRE